MPIIIITIIIIIIIIIITIFMNIIIIMDQFMTQYGAASFDAMIEASEGAHTSATMVDQMRKQTYLNQQKKRPRGGGGC